MAMTISDSRTYYSVTLINGIGDAMDYVQITASLTVTDATIRTVCGSLIGLDHQEEGYVPGPCTELLIEKVEDTRTVIEAAV